MKKEVKTNYTGITLSGTTRGYYNFWNDHQD